MKSFKIFKDNYENMLFLKTILTINKYIEQCDSNNEKVVVSFSGGKDSTVLLDICRRFIDKNFVGIFNNTGVEYPDIINYVKNFENIIWTRPKYTFKDVIKKYGYPIVSKEQSSYIEHVRNPNISEKIKKIRLSNGNFSISKKWRYLLNENIKVSDKCCYHLKKAPLQKYSNKNKLKFLTGERIQESNLRKQRYHTCILPKKCVPLRLWTNNMIDDYIKYFKIKLSSIYKYEKRTGCMFCFYGYHFEDKENSKFTRMQKYFPKLWEFGCREYEIDKIIKIIDKSRK
jgi:3'-phosphoadenosine 5'-phosphosulfate sulfotransferase (PAPS reductase)/FAD synthetase